MQCLGKNNSGTECRSRAMEDGVGYCLRHHPKTEEEAQKAAVELRVKILLQTEIEERNQIILSNRRTRGEIELNEARIRQTELELRKSQLDFDVSDFEAEAIRILKKAATMDFVKDAEAIRTACELAQQIRLAAMWRNGDYINNKKKN